MKSPSSKSFPRVLSGAIAALLCGATMQPASAGTFTWGSATGNFSDPSKWIGLVAPSGIDPTDILIFPGDVGTNVVGQNTSYIATNDIATGPFLLNQLTFQGTNATPGTGPVHTITGVQPFLFSGINPTITQAGTASLVVDAPIRLGANLTFAGNTVPNDTLRDKAMITLNGAVTGNFDITKNGTSTYRFGSTAGTAPSANTWFGTLTINDGTIRFNNNAYTAPTALRSNPVVMTSAGALLTTQFKPTGTLAGQDPDSSLRFGTLSGTAGTVEARRETAVAGVFEGVSVTITTLSSGSFGGTLRTAAINGGANSGTLNLRGVGTQTFTGTLDISKDIKIGDISRLTFGGNSSLALQASGAVILSGGTMRLDNSTTAVADRLRNASSGSTGLETIGGGTFSLVGAATALTETVGRIQLGSATASRAGALTINVSVTNPSVLTALNFQSYSRDAGGTPFNTVNFSANNAAGAPVALGTGATTGPRVTFNTNNGSVFTVPIFNGLLGNTGTADSTSVGWATVNGTDFASYGANGITAVAINTTPAAGGTGSASANVAITGDFAITGATGYVLNSLKMAPTASGQALNLAGAGDLFTNGFLLAGNTDYSITSTGGGSIGNAAGSSPRYFHVSNAMLTVSAGLDGAQAPIVKAGAGTLVLTSSLNSTVILPTILNEGTLRASPGSSLPAGELRFRGGVLEITGGGTFARLLGLGVNRVTWSGINSVGAQVGEEQGSGGFAAVGLDAVVDLTPTAGTDFAWEDPGFVNSGHALIFGSPRADARLTWVDNINLTAVGQLPNYNARQFRAIDNPNSTTDIAVLSGTISGSIRDDLLKTGNGDLILSGNNTYAGATLITDGTLRVNGSITNSSVADVRDGATLAGSGNVAAVQIENNGTLAPGNLAGNTSILSTGDLRFVGGNSKLTIEIGGIGAGGNNTAGYDRVNVVGGITLSGAQLTGSLLNGFTPTETDLFFIIINDGSDAVQGTFAQGNTVTIGSQTFTISYTGQWTGVAETSTFTGGNDVVLRVVPEPGATALLLLGALGLGARRRRA